MTSENTAYYAEPALYADLESQLSIIPGNLSENYKKIEAVASSAFLVQYGEFLNAGQRLHYQDRITLFVDPSDSVGLRDAFDENINTINEEDSPIEGTIYISYADRLPDVSLNSVEVSFDQEPINPGIVWAGRLAIYPLLPDETIAVDPKWLISEDKHWDMTNLMSSKESWASLAPYVYSNAAARVIVHEKVHTIQDDSLPLPILEAAAYFYEREVALFNEWTYTKDNNMQLMADLYADCVEKLGPDVHRLIFGNLDQIRRKELLLVIKRIFSNDKVSELSQSPENRHIYWNTTTLDKVFGKSAAK